MTGLGEVHTLRILIQINLLIFECTLLGFFITPELLLLAEQYSYHDPGVLRGGTVIAPLVAAQRPLKAASASSMQHLSKVIARQFPAGVRG